MEPLDRIVRDPSLTERGSDPLAKTLPQHPPGSAREGAPAHAAVMSKGILLLLLLLALANWGSILHLVRTANGAQDFSIFYTGAKIIRSGHASQLYDLSTQAHYQTSPTYQVRPLPFDHPAYELLLFLPLAFVPFGVAYLVWGFASFVFAWIASRLLAPHLGNFPKPAWLWAFAVIMASFPLVWAIAQGQDSVLLLLVFALVYVKLKSHEDLLAGALLAAGLFKFTLVLPFVIPFLLLRRWKFLTGFAASASAVAGLSVAITGISGARQYVQMLSLLLAHPDVGYINPALMPNVRGFLTTVAAVSGVSSTAFEYLAAGCALRLLIAPVLVFREDERSDISSICGLGLL